MDERNPGQDEERRAALRALLAAEPMPVPEVDDLRRELDEMRSRRRGSVKYS
jgi:hypothetical protein